VLKNPFQKSFYEKGQDHDPPRHTKFQEQPMANFVSDSCEFVDRSLASLFQRPVREQLKQIVIAALFTVLCGLTAMGQDPTTVERSDSQASRKIVTPEQINGTYRSHENEFRILALGHKKLKVQFNGLWMTRYNYPNLGEAIGEASIEGNVATFVPPNTKCKITLTFLTNRMEVGQEGTDSDCGFGRNVTARGTYRRIKGGKPTFLPINR
jgi:hypothetical protein